MSKTKEQWIKETGGFRIGESAEKFLAQARKIQELQSKINQGNATHKDVGELSKLLGTIRADEQ